jgi:hypothetical protein
MTTHDVYPIGEEMNEQDLVYRLRKQAEIHRQISNRHVMEQGQADLIDDLLDEAAAVIELLKKQILDLQDLVAVK